MIVRPSPTAVCSCPECHSGPPEQRPKIERSGLCAECREGYFESWTHMLDELEEIYGTERE